MNKYSGAGAGPGARREARVDHRTNGGENNSMQESNSSLRVSSKDLERFVQAVLRTRGVPEGDAGIVADCLVSANLSGIDTHGVVRLAHYLRRLDNGSINPDPKISFDQPASAVLRVNGDNGLGHVVAQRAAVRGTDICKVHGTASVAIGNSSHFGPASYFLLEAVRRGMGGMVVSHTDAIVVPHGAGKPFFGTNPIAFGFPTPTEPFMLDISTSTIAYGRIELAKVEGKPIPTDWAVDKEGRPTTDPQAVVGMHPLAGHKGSGLAFVVDILSSLFSGMPYGPHITRMYHEMDKPRNLGHFMVFWDIDRFVKLDVFKRRIGEMIDELHELPLFEGFSRVYYPGEIEGERRKDRAARGIPLEEGLFSELQEVAKAADVPAPSLEV